jgi:hypothetical protein
MKKFLSTAIGIIAMFIIILALQGCLKDTIRETYRVYIPVYKSLTEVRADMKSSPAQPLKNTGKLNLFGNYIFLNELNKGIHVIDNSNPGSPKNIAFINIPNNIDLSVKGNYLYADSYSDIVVFDISNPTQVKPVKFLNNVIKDKNGYWYSNQTNPDSIKVVTGYVEKDTTVALSIYKNWGRCSNCMYAQADSRSAVYTSAPQIGISGSMSRFSIVNEFLYVVSNSQLYSLSISNPADPQQTATRNLGWSIETIYPFQDKLFIGSATGMFIYSLNDPANPSQLGQFSHARRCDPVVADDQYAYVTLRGNGTCGGTSNELHIIDISNLSSPVLKKTVSLNGPYGLSKDGDHLFVCDGTDGLKVYDVTTPTSPKFLKQIPGLETYDVIAYGNNAIVVAKDGLYQYDYRDINSIKQLSKISIAKN